MSTMTKEMLKAQLDALNSESSVSDLQQYVNEMLKVRGFADETLKDLMILLTEETGELAKEVRKLANMKTDVAAKPTGNIQNELADILIYLLSICVHLEIDLFEAFKAKEEKNSKRVWS